MAMTTEKLREVFLACEAIISEQGVSTAIRNADAEDCEGRLSHLLWLAQNGFALVEEGRREKAMRWLGFLQGAVWSLKLANIDSLKGMNRPDGSRHDKKRV